MIILGAILLLIGLFAEISILTTIGIILVVVASSGWGRGWQGLANGELLVVRRGSLEVTVEPLGADLVRA